MNESGTSLHWQAPADMPPRTIRDILRNELRCSGTVIRRLRQPGCILVDGCSRRVMEKMEAGSILEAIMTEPDDSTLTPEEIPITILYEDEHLIAIDKTDCMPVHPSSIHRSGTLANAVAWHLASLGKSQRVRPVTRLDRNTSGITLFAKTAHAQYDLARQASEGTFGKTYLGVGLGLWEPPSGSIRLPIRRKPGSIIERETNPEGDASVTHYETLAVFVAHGEAGGSGEIGMTGKAGMTDETGHTGENGPAGTFCSLMRFILETGRTHQIRVHCYACGHSLLGDTLYGGPLWPGLAGQALHCDSLTFLHPVTRQPIHIRSLRSSPMFVLPGIPSFD